MLLSLALDQLKKLEWRHCGGERKIAREILNPLTLGGNRTLRGGQGFLFRRGRCAAGFALLNLPKGKSLGRSKPATNSSNEQAH